MAVEKGPGTRLLIMFARIPQVGQVKTRLSQHIGPAAACQLYSAFLDDLLERLSNGPYDFELHITPWVPDFRPGVRLQAQEDGDLGTRMQRAFERSFARGYQRVVLIGSDVPHMPVSRVHDAFQGLAGEAPRGVLGATEDGGYDLIGLNTPTDVFSGLAFSTSTVLQHTLQRPLSWTVLETEFDVDTMADLGRLPGVSDQLGPRTRRLLPS
jgi:hypothetical protein